LGDAARAELLSGAARRVFTRISSPED
jgi:hypothetical protein